MRIEYKDEKEQQNAAKEEPERIYESDLTPKEKRRREWEKIKELPWKKKPGYLWSYYKIWLLVPVLLLFVIVTGVQIYHNSQEEPLLYVNVADTAVGADEGIQRLSTDLLQICGSGGKHETLPVTTSVLSASDYTSSMQMSVWLTTGEMDIIICDEATYKRYREQEIFLDAEDFPSDGYERLKDHIRDGILYLEDDNWKQYQLVAYEPVCAAIPLSSTHQEAAVKALAYLCGETIE